MKPSEIDKMIKDAGGVVSLTASSVALKRILELEAEVERLQEENMSLQSACGEKRYQDEAKLLRYEVERLQKKVTSLQKLLASAYRKALREPTP